MRIEKEKFDRIQNRVEEIAKENNITVLLAVEAGSRAWNIPSVDSDYDVRFVYVYNDLRKYISFLKGKEDGVIQIQEEDLDIKGYDIRNVYSLIYSGEVNVYEWLASDIVYMENKDLRWLVDKAAEENFDVGSVARCYFGMAKRSFIKDIKWIDQVKVKKYLYAFRAILCCRYVLEHRKPVPLRMDLLMEDMPEEYKNEMRRLLEVRTDTVDNYKQNRSYELEEKTENELGLLTDMLRGNWAKQDKTPDQMNDLLLKYIREKNML